MKNIPTEQMNLEEETTPTTPITTLVHEPFYSVPTELIQLPKKKKKTWILFPILGGALTAVIAVVMVLFLWDTDIDHGSETPTPQDYFATCEGYGIKLSPIPEGESTDAGVKDPIGTKIPNNPEEPPVVIIMPREEDMESEEKTTPPEETTPETETVPDTELTPQSEPEPTLYVIPVQPKAPGIVNLETGTPVLTETATPIPVPPTEQGKIIPPWQNGENTGGEYATNSPPSGNGGSGGLQIPRTAEEIRGNNKPRFGWLTDNGQALYMMEIKTVTSVTKINVAGPDMMATVTAENVSSSYDPEYPLLWRIPISYGGMSSGRYTVNYYVGTESVTEDVWVN